MMPVCMCDSARAKGVMSAASGASQAEVRAQRSTFSKFVIRQIPSIKTVMCGVLSLNAPYSAPPGGIKAYPPAPPPPRRHTCISPVDDLFGRVAAVDDLFGPAPLIFLDGVIASKF